MFWIAVTAGALLALFGLTRVVFRRPSRSMAQLGTVSRKWLDVHRTADQ